MARVSMVVGGLLILLAVGFYLGYLIVGGTADTSLTALIPLVPGVPILAAGLVATQGEKARKHAMHIAMLFALLGILSSGYPIYKAISSGTIGGAAVESLLMLLISAIYLALGIKSFVDARKARAE